MKYIFRFLGVIIAWPGYLILGFTIKFTVNLFSVLWNFSFKGWDVFTIRDIYFPLGTHGEIGIEEDIRKDLDAPITYKTYLKDYDYYYKTPMDMLKNNQTRFEI